jgi:hypothetical protein
MNEIVKEALSDATWIFLTTIIPPLVSASFALVRWIIPAFVGFLRSKLSQKQMEALERAAGLAVLYAEQVARSESVQRAAGYKYALAEASVNSFLQRSGMKFSAAQIRAAIEAAVAAEFNRGREPRVEEPVAPAELSEAVERLEAASPVCEGCHLRSPERCPFPGEEGNPEGCVELKPA